MAASEMICCIAPACAGVCRGGRNTWGIIGEGVGGDGAGLGLFPQEISKDLKGGYVGTGTHTPKAPAPLGNGVTETGLPLHVVLGEYTESVPPELQDVPL